MSKKVEKYRVTLMVKLHTSKPKTVGLAVSSLESE